MRRVAAIVGAILLFSCTLQTARASLDAHSNLGQYYSGLPAMIKVGQRTAAHRARTASSIGGGPQA